jgi:hypothetical protein
MLRSLAPPAAPRKGSRRNAPLGEAETRRRNEALEEAANPAAARRVSLHTVQQDNRSYRPKEGACVV